MAAGTREASASKGSARSQAEGPEPAPRASRASCRPHSTFPAAPAWGVHTAFLSGEYHEENHCFDGLGLDPCVAGSDAIAGPHGDAGLVLLRVEPERLGLGHRLAQLRHRACIGR